MKRFRITVNGRSYEVIVEEIGGVPRPSIQTLSPSPGPPLCRRGPLPSNIMGCGPTATRAKEDRHGIMASPLPGVVLKLRAQPGMVFARGEVLLTIEAMKMENEILAPHPCRVEGVHVQEGQAVRTGQPLLKIIQT